MRVVLVMALILGLIAAIAVGGCAKKTIVTPGGVAQVQKTGKDSAKVTLKGNNGETTTIESNKNAKVTEAELGVPIYPGADVGDAGSWSMSGKEGSGSTNACTMKTKDPYDKVYAFYKDKIKNPTMAMENKDADGKPVGMFQIVSEDKKTITSVAISEKDGETEIVVTKIKQG